MELLQQFIHLLIQNLHDHGVKIATALALGIIGWVIGSWQARRQWQKQQFLDRINFSLTRIENGKLQIRTLIEKPMQEVLMNQYACQKLVAQAQKTTVKDPLIRFPKDDSWNFLNPVINEISQRFAEGHLQKDLGGTVKTGTYIMALTFEQAGPVRTQKIRVMVINKDLITKLPKEAPQIDNPSHITRWETLQTLAVSYVKEPNYFKEVELSM